MSNKKYWDLTPQTGVTENDLLTFAKQDGSDFITSYISLEDFLSSIAQDANVNLGPVLDNTVSNPSTLTPNNDDRYIVASGATGAWSANTNSIAQWNDTDNQWDFYVPISGDRTIVTTGINAGKIYEFNGTSWNEVILPVTSATPFLLAGTTVDAGSNKTSRISRTGDVLIGSTGSSLNAKFVINGKTIANAYATRTGYASTSDITRTGKWYRVMNFDCNYSIYATHHFKIILGFNGNSNGAGFVAELDINIKRQNTQIFVSATINQSINGIKLVYDADKNIEFLFNNTTKRVTMYFRPDQNYSSLSLTMLNPKETASTRFSFLNQYLGTTDLNGEVNDTIVEKQILIADTYGDNTLRKKIYNQQNENQSETVQTPTMHYLTTKYGDGTYNSSLLLNPEKLEVSLNGADFSSTILNDTIQNYYQLTDFSNQLFSTTKQEPGQFEKSISDNNNNLSSLTQLNNNRFSIRVNDDLNGKSSKTNISFDESSTSITNNNNDNTAERRSDITTHSDTILLASNPDLQTYITQVNDEADFIVKAGLVDVNNDNSSDINIVNNKVYIRTTNYDGTLGLKQEQTQNLWRIYNAAGTQNYISIEPDDIAGTIAMFIHNLPTYNNNNDAVAAGLQVNQVYKSSSGELKIVHA